MTESQIEEEAIKNFVVKHRKERFLNLLKKREIGEGFGELAHFTQNLDLRFCTKIPSLNKTAEVDFVVKKVKEFTSDKKCYIMSETSSFDGQWMNLKDALEEIIGRGMGALLILENGKVIYHESEEVKERYIGIRM